MEVRSVRAEPFLTDGQTDMRTLVVAFLNFCECAKNFFTFFKALSYFFYFGNEVKYKN